MKLVLAALTALVAVATVNSHYLPASEKSALYQDIHYFINMIPMEKVTEVVVQYAVEDTEFQQLLAMIKSEEFKQMVSEVEAIPEFQEFLKYLLENGVNAYDLVNGLNKIVGLPSLQPTLYGKTTITGGLKGLFQDVKAYISYDKFIHGYVKKMKTSPAFRDFVAELKSSGHQKFINALYANERYLNFREMLVEKNVDVALMEDIIYTVLGIEFPEITKPAVFQVSVAAEQSELSKDIHDFLNLLDKDKIFEIVFNYLEDEQVQQALSYMYSDDFHKLVLQVEALKEYQDLVLYLQSTGLDVVGLIQKIHAVFGMDPYEPPTPAASNFESIDYVHTYKNLGGMKGMVDAIKATLPMKEIKALYEEKMSSSKAFASFVQYLQSPEFTKIIDTIYSAPIFQEMKAKAQAVGLDLREIRNILTSVIGIHLPSN